MFFALAMVASPAYADVSSWNGANPFKCTLQNGASLSNPSADPFCVTYSHSLASPTDVPTELTNLLTNGPNQLAAVSSACSGYEVDHWNGPPGLASADRALYFNKATGAGGVAVSNFTIAGMPATVPGVPAQLAPFFGPGGGGGQMSGDVQVDPNCAPSAPGGGGTGGGGGGGTGGGDPGAGGGTSGSPNTVSGALLPSVGSVNSAPPASGPSSNCANRSGGTNNGIGRAKLGAKRATIAKRFGTPTRKAFGYYHYCLKKGGDLGIHFSKKGKADVIMSSGKSFHAGKVKIGSKLSTVRSSLRHDQVLGHAKREWVIGVSHKHWRLLVGLVKNRVVYIAAVSKSLSYRRLGSILVDSAR
ncbi:MAG TPA: hypothetical protein VGI67_22735 [Thermoleophilaceae bacterium]